MCVVDVEGAGVGEAGGSWDVEGQDAGDVEDSKGIG